MKKIILAGLAFFLLISCRKVEQMEVFSKNEILATDYLYPLSPFLKDQEQDFFSENQWYAYDQGNHIIWPNFRVFGLRNEDQYFRFQILSYYDSFSQPGNYTVRIQEEGQTEKVFSLSAAACGNVYTNPNYEECEKDPGKNIFTYLNINTGKVFKVTELEAAERNDWHIAFNGTDIRLNSGIHGPGNVRVANLYLYGAYFQGNRIDFQRLSEESFGPQGRRFFDLDFEFRKAAYALPAGRDRVIHEDDWFENDGQFFKAIDKNWWIVQSVESKAINKLNFSEIREEIVIIDDEEHIQTEFVLNLIQKSKENPAWMETQWVVPTFTTEKRVEKICFDIDMLSVVDCSKENADLIFSAMNRKSGGRFRRRWRINTVRGAMGPLNEREARTWN